MDAKNPVENRHDPINEWRLFEVGDAVQPRGNPVAGLQHVARNLSLNCVHVVHQGRWRNDATQIDDCGNKQDGQVDAPALAGNKTFRVSEDAA